MKPSDKGLFEQEDPLKVFNILSEIASGSFGSVHRAIHLPTGKEVALKICEIDRSDEDSYQDLCLEIQILRDCSHPNVVGYFGSYKKGDEVYIGMELCEGGAINDYYDAIEEPLPEPVIAFIMRETLKGLAYMHAERNIIHRDIKAANILLTKRGSVKLADFGVSAVMKSAWDRRMTFVGTPYWMAPEVINTKLFNLPYDVKCDIWSLGITCIELAECDVPHGKMDPMKALFEIPKRAAPSLAKRSKWSPEFCNFVTRCLTKDVDDRPSAEALLSHDFVTQRPAHRDDVVKYMGVTKAKMDNIADRQDDWGFEDGLMTLGPSDGALCVPSAGGGNDVTSRPGTAEENGKEHSSGEKASGGGPSAVSSPLMVKSKRGVAKRKRNQTRKDAAKRAPGALAMRKLVHEQIRETKQLQREQVSRRKKERRAQDAKVTEVEHRQHLERQKAEVDHVTAIRDQNYECDVVLSTLSLTSSSSAELASSGRRRAVSVESIGVLSSGQATSNRSTSKKLNRRKSVGSLGALIRHSSSADVPSLGSISEHAGGTPARKASKPSRRNSMRLFGSLKPSRKNSTWKHTSGPSSLSARSSPTSSPDVSPSRSPLFPSSTVSSTASGQHHALVTELDDLIGTFRMGINDVQAVALSTGFILVLPEDFERRVQSVKNVASRVFDLVTTLDTVPGNACENLSTLSQNLFSSYIATLHKAYEVVQGVGPEADALSPQQKQTAEIASKSNVAQSRGALDAAIARVLDLAVRVNVGETLGVPAIVASGSSGSSSSASSPQMSGLADVAGVGTASVDGVSGGSVLKEDATVRRKRLYFLLKQRQRVEMEYIATEEAELRQAHWKQRRQVEMKHRQVNKQRQESDLKIQQELELRQLSAQQALEKRKMLAEEEQKMKSIQEKQQGQLKKLMVMKDIVKKKQFKELSDEMKLVQRLELQERKLHCELRIEEHFAQQRNQLKQHQEEARLAQGGHLLRQLHAFQATSLQQELQHEQKLLQRKKRKLEATYKERELLLQLLHEEALQNAKVILDVRLLRQDNTHTNPVDCYEGACARLEADYTERLPAVKERHASKLMAKDRARHNLQREHYRKMVHQLEKHHDTEKVVLMQHVAAIHQSLVAVHAEEKAEVERAHHRKATEYAAQTRLMKLTEFGEKERKAGMSALADQSAADSAEMMRRHHKEILDVDAVGEARMVELDVQQHKEMQRFYASFPTMNDGDATTPVPKSTAPTLAGLTRAMGVALPDRLLLSAKSARVPTNDMMGGRGDVEHPGHVPVHADTTVTHLRPAIVPQLQQQEREESTQVETPVPRKLPSAQQQPTPPLPWQPPLPQGLRPATPKGDASPQQPLTAQRRPSAPPAVGLMPPRVHATLTREQRANSATTMSVPPAPPSVTSSPSTTTTTTATAKNGAKTTTTTTTTTTTSVTKTTQSPSPSSPATRHPLTASQKRSPLQTSYTGFSQEEAEFGSSSDDDDDDDVTYASDGESDADDAAGDGKVQSIRRFAVASKAADSSPARRPLLSSTNLLPPRVHATLKKEKRDAAVASSARASGRTPSASSRLANEGSAGSTPLPPPPSRAAPRRGLAANAYTGFSTEDAEFGSSSEEEEEEEEDYAVDDHGDDNDDAEEQAAEPFDFSSRKIRSTSTSVMTQVTTRTTTNMLRDDVIVTTKTEEESPVELLSPRSAEKFIEKRPIG
eukprot:TRINITY_DN1098_c0_g2_i1.p1 TRINITY_DN1098_c0_g2~~TRINITY_DN1098_c0_g2_i1.p1  ORF type:complete len:1692 (+),score=469.52 TRINITY_DN1098_c0_g2_i1:276-5351(+)